MIQNVPLVLWSRLSSLLAEACFSSRLESLLYTIKAKK
jgi:hypothetical protein